MNITGHTGLLALFGSPVAHSGSPAMYNYSFNKLGLDYVYVAIDVGREGLKEAVAAARLYNMRGFNLTMPCKNDVISYIDELSLPARFIGAVNTVVNENGKLIGYNTDGIGFIKNLAAHNIEIADKRIVVAGAGGAATAIVVQSALDGVAEISIFNKKSLNFDKMVETIARIKDEVPNVVISINDIEDEKLFTNKIKSADIFINATAVGMKPLDNESIVKDISAFRKGLVVADVVYNPLETRLLKEAKERGCTCIDGKGMLLWQGVYAFELYTGKDMPVEEVRKKFF
ncbi:MAG: shikimate dehydrogenase [Catonella sp.]|uniref:shikimate dehydrogenase n=1 Tax=Catonella sp. TaxID=2382125 RepID=UPI003FA1238F